MAVISGDFSAFLTSLQTKTARTDLLAYGSVTEPSQGAARSGAFVAKPFAQVRAAPQAVQQVAGGAIDIADLRKQIGPLRLDLTRLEADLVLEVDDGALSIAVRETANKAPELGPGGIGGESLLR